MKKRVSISKTFEVLGAIGLIASLMFVAYEIRQNTIAARASAIQEIGIATADMWGEIARDPQLLRVMLKRSDIQTSALSSLFLRSLHFSRPSEKRSSDLCYRP
jgi:hypothetical protein